MSVRRTVEKWALRVRGVDLEEMEEEWRQLDEAKAKRERERERAIERLEQEYELYGLGRDE